MNNREVVAHYFECVNEEKWEDLGNLFAPDAVYRSTGIPPFEGRKAIIDGFRHLFHAWTKHDDRPTNIILEGNSAAVEVSFTGVSTGGRDIAFGAIDIFKLRDSKIVKLATWYDLRALARKLKDDNQ